MAQEDVRVANRPNVAGTDVDHVALHPGKGSPAYRNNAILVTLGMLDEQGAVLVVHVIELQITDLPWPECRGVGKLEDGPSPDTYRVVAGDAVEHRDEVVRAQHREMMRRRRAAPDAGSGGSEDHSGLLEV